MFAGLRVSFITIIRFVCFLNIVIGVTFNLILETRHQRAKYLKQESKSLLSRYYWAWSICILKM